MAKRQPKMLFLFAHARTNEKIDTLPLPMPLCPFPDAGAEGPSS